MADGTLLAIAHWREGAERLAEEVAHDWELTLGRPYSPGTAAHVVRAALPDGTPAALKVFWPHREAEQEADALERWNGNGAVRLYRRDDERAALLLERCEPGAFLSSAADPVGVLVELLPRLWTGAEGFRLLAEEAEIWREHDLVNVRDNRLRDLADGYLRELGPTQGELVLVHQDLHAENVLAAQREPWLVIDPKPLAGEREFGVVAIVRGTELGHSRRDVLYRLDRVCDELRLDRDRVRGWTIAHSIAWSGGSDIVESHLEVVEWLR